MRPPAATEAHDLPLHVESQGRGPPLVLIHGFGASSFSWRNWAPELARDHEVVLVDLEGFGAARKGPGSRYDPVHQAELVASLVVQRDLRGTTLVGHSLGGGVALLTAFLLRDRGEGGRVARLVIVAGAAYAQAIPPFMSMARHALPARGLLRLLPTDWLFRKILSTVVHDPSTVSTEQVRGYAAPFRDAEGRRALVDAARQVVPDDVHRWTGRYPELDLPALLIWGREDPVIPLRLGQRLATDLPRARLEVIPECGHLPFEEKPAESLRLVRDFLAGTGEADA